MNIKAVVFDYGQVITYPQDPGTMDILAELAGVERVKLVSSLWALRGDYDKGVISSYVYFKKVLAYNDVIVDDGVIHKMAEIDMESWKNINPDTVALMEDLKKAGYLLGILSNMPGEFLVSARKTMPVFSLPDFSLFSCDVKLIKPDEAIYRKLLSMAGVKNGELVFFDDIPENVKSARAIGIEAFVWKNPENARRELKSLGVRL